MLGYHVRQPEGIRACLEFFALTAPSPLVRLTAPSSDADQPPRPRLALVVALLGILLILITLSVTAFGLWLSHNNVLEDAERNARNLVQALEEQTARTVQSVDITLLGLSENVNRERGGTPPNLPALLQQKLAALPYVRTLLVVDADGRIRHSSNLALAIGLNVADREYFTWHRDHADNTLHIGPPIRGRTDGRWFIAMSRRLYKSDGGFDGVVLAAVEPAYFQRFYETLRVGEGGTVTMLSRDGVLLARTPHADDHVGRSFASVRLFKELLPAAEEGSYRQVSAVDGMLRLFSYRVVRGLPLVVLVGLSEESVLKSWYDSARIYGVASLVLTLAFCLLFVVLVQQIRRRERLLNSLHESEAAVRQLNEDLEQRVLERTEELERANRELMTFSYSVSHDLRAPLRSIDGFSHVLMEDYGDRLDEAGRDYLVRVRAASQRMAELIDDMLYLAKTLRSELKREPVDLSAMARDVVVELEGGELARAGVVWVIEDSVRAEADPHLLRVVLQNLLGNALKYSAQHATARIEFGVLPKRQSGKPVFFVKDDGAGFDMRFADKLFGVFQRLHKDEQFPGHGVGLATVQRIVQRHGGRVWAEGVVEQGATFYFTL